MYLLMSPKIHCIVSTRWLSCWWCWSAWEGPWWMIGPGRACSTWSTSNKVLGTWYLQYLVLGIWCFKYLVYIKQAGRSNRYLASEVLGLNHARCLQYLLYIKQAARSNWYLVPEVLGLHQAMWGHMHACASFVVNFYCFDSSELSLALSGALKGRLPWEKIKTFHSYLPRSKAGVA